MRVTAETKAATRERILEAARRQFAAQGYAETTTRDIARAAGIGIGTLFNYFATKEAIVECLVGEALTGVSADGEAESLEEALFAYVVAGLRKLKPLRSYVGPLLETSLSPLASSRGDAAAESLRLRHLETVMDLAGRFGMADALTPTALQLYWTLYTGVLAFWATDKSPRQEDTLALLDDSLEMFVNWLK